MKIKRNAPQKIVIIAGPDSITCNSINQALERVHRLLSEGRIVIEIENVSEKIAVVDRLINSENIDLKPME